MTEAAGRPQPVARMERLQLERPLPSSIDAERSILGAILLDNHALNVATEKLKPEDFFHDHHLHILRQMIVLDEARSPIDLVTLTDQLGRVGKLESVGGAAYLAQLMDGVPHVSNVEHYARIVKEKSLLRAVIYATHAIQQQALDGEDEARTILDRANQIMNELRGASATGRSVMVMTAPEVATLVPAPIEFVAYPFAARGMISVVDGGAKTAGKTTLLLTAVSAALREVVFLNQATRRGPVLYVTEEGRRTFLLALERAQLTDQPDLHVLFARSAALPWPDLARLIECQCVELGVVWLVVDTFFAVAGLGGEEENKAGAVDEALVPIRQMANDLDIAVTLSRHTRKSGGTIGESGRGSVAFTGGVDIVTELKRSAGNWPGMRQLEITGRIDEAKLDIELRDGNYCVVSREEDETEPRNDAEVIRQFLARSPGSSQHKVVQACGFRWNRVREILAEHDGKLWRKESGARNAVLYYPV